MKLFEALCNLTGDELREYLKLVANGEKIPHRKDDMAEIFQRKFSEQIGDLWIKLSKIEQLAIAEAIYSSGGKFDELSFEAKYGEVPKALDWYGGYKKSPPLFRLFIYSWYRGECVVPFEIGAALKVFVAKPAAFHLVSLLDISASYEQQIKHYDWQEGDSGITVATRGGVYLMPSKTPKVSLQTIQMPLLKREMEAASQHDLQEMMRLIAKGRISVGEKTGAISATSVKEAAGVLLGGDFYELSTKKEKYSQEIGAIRAFAWPLILQAGGLAEIKGKKLALTRDGQSALLNPVADVLKHLWEAWLGSNLFDEFRRIDTIKGQSGKGSYAFTATTSRRNAIVRALKECPEGRWLKFNDFSRYMRANKFDFKVTSSPGYLYISDANYGNLSDQDSSAWTLLQGLYLQCFLFEYAATLGLIDVAYIQPEDADRDYSKFWGTDDLDFLSRYDGLTYFRITPFGAYCLGQTAKYDISKAQHDFRISILPSMQVSIVDGELSVGAELLLDRFADREKPGVWRLARSKAVASLEAGHEIKELEKFLRSSDEQPLPETVESFIKTLPKQASALSRKGMAIVFECADKELADVFASNRCTKDFCKKAGDKNLVVPQDLEEQFKKAVHILGYGVAQN